MWRDLWATHRKAVLIILIATVLLIAGGAVLVFRHQPADEAAPPQGVPATEEKAPPATEFAPATAGGADAEGSGGALPDTGSVPTAATGYDHTEWDAIPAVTPRTTSDHPPIRADLRTQPDTFAAAFGTELLTQNYANTSRADLLAWAQSEAAPLTITQVPLTDTDRGKALIVSLTSPDWDGTPSTPVPSDNDWTELASLRAWTTVTGVKVEAVPDFPPANVSFTDPLTLARLYSATVTLHSTFSTTHITSSFSVAFEIVLGTSQTHGRVFGAACTQDYVQRTLS